MNTSVRININDEKLLMDFNIHKKYAFSEVYMKYFDELEYFAQKLFYNTNTASEDVVQDVFISIWNKRIDFKSLEHIKSYVYNGIKNRHIDHIRHNSRHTDYSNYMKENEDYYTSAYVETEIISLLNFIDDILPSQMAKVIRLYIEGYDTKEIADKLDKSVNTIYYQKNSAINILKIKLSKSKFDFFSIFIG